MNNGSDRTMAYAGYLVKIGTYEVPFKFINHDTFQCEWDKIVQGTYTDADGELHEDGVLKRRIMIVSWETPNLNDVEMQEFLSAIKAQYLNARAKSCMVTAYMPEEGVYKTDKCRLSSEVRFPIRYADVNGLRYNPVRIEFTGYGTASAE